MDPVDIGRSERIRTSDPLHPMQVRYQAAPRPDRLDESPFLSARKRERMIRESSRHRQLTRASADISYMHGEMSSAVQRWHTLISVALTPQYPQYFFQLAANLPNDLLRLRHVLTRLVALQSIARAANGEALFV